jgi:predicted enzyme related to lactoylglutathione lyase
MMHARQNDFLSDLNGPGKIRGPGAQLGRAGACMAFAALLGIMGAVPVLAAPVQLPALVEPASREHHVGKIIFVDLVTPDLAVAKQFYAGLFGWTFRDIHWNGKQYAEALLDGRPVAGLLQKNLPAEKHRRSSWLSFIAVRDVDAVKVAALQHGAKMLFEPHDLPDRGREAVFADPQGAAFAVLASSSGDPPDVLAEPGEWIWSSLITRDVDTGSAFYQALFDYEVFDLPADKGAKHLMLASDDYARASVNSLPANKPDMPSHWLNFVRVDDAARVAAKVVALGGKVLVEPRPDRHGGKVAVVADPFGALFGLLEWTDADSKEIGK